MAHRTDPPGEGGVHGPTGTRYRPTRSSWWPRSCKAPSPSRASCRRTGLAAFGDDGDDLMMALARKIVGGDEDENDAETVEAVFAQARNAEATAEELLVDDGWKIVEVEPEAVAVNSLPRTGYGGHDDLFGIGPTVELTPVNGNGNGHHDEAEEPQQSLFSWAEFMAEEPVKPKRRNGKPQPASMSIFEWAMELEQEREKETVYARR